MQEPTKNSFAFVLGREQEICLEELKSVLSRFCFSFSIYRITGNVVLAKLENFSEKEAKDLINVLGGTVKIYKILDALGNDITAQLSNLISQLKKEPQGKVNFGISSFNPNLRRQQINSFALGAKKRLRGKMSLRYVESREGSELSTIVTLKNNLEDKGIEFGIFENEIGSLVSLNNPEEWSKRDYGKPASDKQSGMLPPKLARIMINLVLGEIEITKPKLQIPNKNQNDQILNLLEIRNSDLEIPQHEVLVVDPFCGSGNILLEALMLGCDVIGSDVSEKAVLDTKQNIEWLKDKYQVESSKYQVFQADATDPDFIKKLTTYNLQLTTSHNRIAVVTEPYLGEPKKYKPSLNAVWGEYKKIQDMYLSFLKNLHGVIPSGAEGSFDSKISPRASLGRDDKGIVLCIVFPLVETIEGERFSLFRESVDEIKNLGYTQIRPSMIYGREYQVVKREIALLKLSK